MCVVPRVSNADRRKALEQSSEFISAATATKGSNHMPPCLTMDKDDVGCKQP